MLKSHKLGFKLDILSKPHRLHRVAIKKKQSRHKMPIKRIKRQVVKAKETEKEAEQSSIMLTLLVVRLRMG